MSQTKYDIKITDKAVAEEFVKKTETIKGVKFVNVNIESGSVVVTHNDDYDEATFKAIAGI